MNFLTRASISLIFLAVFSLNSRAEPEAMFTVRVTDETGSVVTNAEVHAGFVESIKPGWGWGGGKEKKRQGVTDTNGLCVVKETCQGEAGVAAGKDGYYWSSGYKLRFTNYVGTLTQRWEPWNPTVEVLLKRTGKPIPMYAKWIRDAKIPADGRPIGFDLMKGDWVAPNGRGATPDFIMTYRRVNGGKTASGYQIHDTTLTIAFSNDGDGIQSILVPPRRGGSALRLPREAPETDYMTNLVKNAFEHPEKSSTGTSEDQNYFFRVRTKKDDKGNIVSALYGKIQGDFSGFDYGKLTFTYCLNPTPNDRNVEFDPTKNLFKNLSSLEEVRAP